MCSGSRLQGLCLQLSQLWAELLSSASIGHTAGPLTRRNFGSPWVSLWSASALPLYHFGKRIGAPGEVSLGFVHEQKVFQQPAKAY